MFAWSMKILLPLALLNCIHGRVLMMPKFYGQDSAVIVDTDKSKFNPKLQNALYYNIPVYKLFKPMTTTTTTTTAPIGLIEEYPSDLLYIARNKLGLKRLEQLPSIRELGELLGTGNAEDTIKYIRALTSNDQGIALMKAYLGSLDYDQSEPEAETRPDIKFNDEDNDTDADYDDEMPLKEPKLETTTKAAQWELEEGGGLMQHVNDFMKQYGMWSEETTTVAPTPAPVVYKPLFVAPQLATVKPPRPLFARRPWPSHVPIPMPTRVPSTTAIPPTPKSPHLNSPKVPANSMSGHVAPHVQQLAQIANIPPSVLDTFLQQQPKLAELARRVSRLPLVQQHSRAIDSQLLVAVQKALSQDENLKHLLSASQTLK
ncbi:uncharacterized protein LOC117784753 [Drosophila innubila]|uniref:uncharacterized protein LOC117784753 n=1 Tax=Drosophila innubila TaxID=198719 RepID=UPI00148B9625|nr:uncharacterized protein LOC117784753 [Drosophila innubila]